MPTKREIQIKKDAQSLAQLPNAPTNGSSYGVSP